MDKFIKEFKENYKEWAGGALEFTMLSNYDFQVTAKDLPNYKKIIKIEDLIDRPEDTVKSVCKEFKDRRGKKNEDKQKDA